MGVKRILAAYEKQYEKSISQTPEQRAAKNMVWVDMAAQLRKRGKELRKELRAEHIEIEDQYLKDHRSVQRTDQVFKDLPT